MKYLLIFLPIFCFGQDTIVRGLDTMIIGRPYYDNPSFYREWTRIGKHKDFTQGGDSTLYSVRPSTVDTCWEIKNGWMSCISIPSFASSGDIINFKTQEFYVSDRKPKIVESFKYLGAYYELRENGWYKEILPDTFPDYITGDIRIKGDSVFRWSEEPKWIPCDQHFGNVDHRKRDKIEQSEVKILVWTGCTLAEYKVTKFYGYNYHDDQFYVSGRTMNRFKKDFIVWYLAGDKWIKNSHVIKEL